MLPLLNVFVGISISSDLYSARTACLCVGVLETVCVSTFSLLIYGCCTRLCVRPPVLKNISYLILEYVS